MRYLELLQTEPRFRRLWIGQLVSQCGDWLQFVALLRVFSSEGREVELLAGIFIVRMAPWVLWSPIAGAFADRFSRSKVMVACDLGRACAVLCFLFVKSADDAPVIYALLFLQDSLTAFFEPARAAAIAQLTSPRALLTASSLSGLTWSAMLAFGSAFGGLLVAGVGVRTAFLVDALYLFSGNREPRTNPRPESATGVNVDVNVRRPRSGSRLRSREDSFGDDFSFHSQWKRSLRFGDLRRTDRRARKRELKAMPAR